MALGSGVESIFQPRLRSGKSVDEGLRFRIACVGTLYLATVVALGVLPPRHEAFEDRHSLAFALSHHFRPAVALDLIINIRVDTLIFAGLDRYCSYVAAVLARGSEWVTGSWLLC